jgi:hypothetical protein
MPLDGNRIKLPRQRDENEEGRGVFFIRAASFTDDEMVIGLLPMLPRTRAQSAGPIILISSLVSPPTKPSLCFRTRF